MADQNESFSFDASGAINEMKRLEKATRKSNTAIEQFNRTVTTKVVDPFDKLAASADKAAAAITKMTTAAGEPLGRSRKKVQDLTLSWETLTRIVQTQLIIRGLNALADAFTGSAEAAAEFQLTIARTANIVKDLGINGLKAEVKALAVELGRPLQEVAEATFEAMQNDLGTTQQTMALLRTDIQALALVTGGDLGAAVNAVSSAIKGFGLEGDKARGIADKFFRAIDTGRITLSELENSLGTVANLGRQVGITFEETLAAVSAITLTGTSASVAFTQLRNVMNKAIKPTEALEAIYSKLGVETFRQLKEQSGGLIQALRAISDAVGGDEEKISKAFNTIRGNLGVFNLLGNEGKDFERILDQVTNSAGAAADAVDAINRTDARQAQKNAARLESIYVDLGETALKVKNLFSAFFLTFIPDTKAAVAAITLLGTAFTIAGTKAFLSITAVKTALVTLTPLLIATGVALAGIAAFAGLSALVDNLNEVDKTLTNMAREGAKLSKKIALDQLKTQSEELGKSFQKTNVLLEASLGTAGILYDEIIAKTKETSELISEFGDSVIARFADKRKAALKEIGKAIEGIDGFIKSTAQDLLDVTQKIEEVQFNKALEGLNDLQRAAALATRAEEKLAEAREATAKAGASEEEQRHVQRLQEISDTASAEAKAAAAKTKNATAIARVDGLEIANLTNVQAGLKQKLSTLKSINKDALRTEELSLNRLSELDKQRARNILDLASAFDESGIAKTNEKFAEDAAKANDEYEKLRDSLVKQGEAKLFKSVGLKDAFNRDSNDFLRSLSNAGKLGAEAREELITALSAEPFQAQVELALKLDTKTGNEIVDQALKQAQGVDKIKQVRDQKSALQKIINDNNKAEAQLVRETARVTTAIADAQDAIGEAQAFELFDFTGGGATGKKLADAMTGALDAIPQATEAALHATASVVRQNQAELNRLIEEGSLTPERAAKLKEFLEQTATAIQARFESIKIEKLIDEEAVQVAQTRLDEFTEQIQESFQVEVEIDTTKVKGLTDSLTLSKQEAFLAAQGVLQISENADTATESVGGLVTTTSGLVTVADRVAGAFEQVVATISTAITKANELAQKQQNNPVRQYFGGQVSYRAQGGTRGRDTQLAAVDPAEFIVNSRSSKNFFSDLQAINSGTGGRNEGGSVTNINVGDINVTSQSQLPSDTAREVGQSINREIRRRTLR